MRSKCLYSIILFIVSAPIFSQTYTMTNNGSASTCSGIFLDPGGAGNYQNNLNYVYTLCPSTPGSFIQLDFTMFDVEAGWDYLEIYDGGNTASPLIGQFDDNQLQGLSIVATNPSGCLTFEFDSDGIITESGWSANISCAFSCQTVQANLLSSNPTLNSNSEIEICQGSTVSFVGSGLYPQNGTNYTQSDATSTFEWDFGCSSSTATGTNVSHLFPNSGMYNVELTVTDVNGCESTNTIPVNVLVSTTPNFTGTIANPATICLGQQSTITGIANPVMVDC